MWAPQVAPLPSSSTSSIDPGGHEARRRRAMPVILARLEETPDRPGGSPRPGAGCEVDAAHAQARGAGGCRDGVDADRAGEPLARPDRGLDGVRWRAPPTT